ncbi:MAG: heme lyase CcmF/NrfE family subunit [Actinobacteria bacterium]|nr:heme lyase CcmF/NrfE family subunit [Actinomycetota bacterium]
MNAALGTAGVTLGLAGAVLGVVVLAVGLRRRRRALAAGEPPAGAEALLHLGRPFAWLVLAGAVLATVAMEIALVTHDFSLTYVAENGSRATPLLYTVASLWAALEGSIILWALVLSGFLAAVAHRFRHQASDPLVAWATLTMLAVAVFFFALMLGPADPFTTVAGAVPADGPGPNPLLQNHPLMAIHPPLLYLGYVGFTVPFAFAVAALVTGRLDEGWLAATRRWALAAWGFLTVGIVLGAWWSYEVLGWGGFWAWDPVENASFLPWLTGTAYIHSVMVQQRRGMLRVWNLSLLLATFSLTILGTFLTRSGVLDSVHSFTESPIGPWLLSFFGVVVAVILGLIAWRGDRLRAPGRIDSPVSREGAFLANNVVFAAFAFVVLLGTVFPLVVEAVNGERLSVGTPYFNRMTTPLGLALLFLMAVAPALPWRKASGELLRTRLQWPAWGGAGAVAGAVLLGARGLAPLLAFGLGGFAAAGALRQLALSVRAARRRGASVVAGLVGRSSGGMIVHLGVVLVAVAFAAASAYLTGEEVRLAPGQSATVAGHTVTYQGMNPPAETPQKTVFSARVQVDGGVVYEPALNRFPNATQTIGTPSVRTSLTDDVYLTLVAMPEEPGDPALIGVLVQPLVAWLWIGGGVMALGTLLALWPGERRRRVPAPSPAPAEERRAGGDAGEAGEAGEDTPAPAVVGP